MSALSCQKLAVGRRGAPIWTSRGTQPGFFTSAHGNGDERSLDLSTGRRSRLGAERASLNTPSRSRPCAGRSRRSGRRARGRCGSPGSRRSCRGARTRRCPLASSARRTSAEISDSSATEPPPFGRLAGRLGRAEVPEPRRIAGLLHVHAEVDHVADHLDVPLGLHVAPHHAEAQPGLAVLGDEAGDDRVERPLPRLEPVGDGSGRARRGSRGSGARSPGRPARGASRSRGSCSGSG